MRNRSSRSFTVETKSGGRQRPIIPQRAPAAAAPRPAVHWPSATEPQAPVPEPRRILPSLIVAEAPPDEPELTPAAEERSAKPRRERPPKAKSVAPEFAMEPLAEPTHEIAAPAPVPELSETRLVRATKLPALPIGERWKRRLGRWAR